MGTDKVAFAGDRAEDRTIAGSVVTGSDMTESDASHVTGSDVSQCPEVCSVHAQPEVAPYPP